MQKILMSACLLGAKVRYDGGDCEQQNSLLNQWRTDGRIVTICPEMAGGLPIPRPPAEIIGQGGGEAVLKFQAKVAANTQQDVSDEFRKGAELALALAQKHPIKIAILKTNSPSCNKQASMNISLMTPFGKRGVQNIYFVMSELKKTNSYVNFDNIGFFAYLNHSTS